MSRYIDADVLLNNTDGLEHVKWSQEYGHVVLVCDIVYSPTLDVQEVKHGKWIWQGSISEGCWVCSECEHKFYQGYGNENYCPHCGAKMDGKETEDAETIH